MQMIPMPRASSTWFSVTMSIDISTSEIARSWCR